MPKSQPSVPNPEHKQQNIETEMMTYKDGNTTATELLKLVFKT